MQIESLRTLRERSLATNSLGRTAASFCDFALVKPGFRPWNYTQTDRKSFVDHLIQKNLEPSDGEPQKWAQKSSNCPKCNYFSQHCQWVIRKRECPLCWCTERREVFNPHVRKQHSSSTGGLPHMKREVPMHSLLMCYACAISKPKHQLLLFEKDRYSNVEGRCNSKTLRCLSEIVAVTLTGSKKFLQSANKRHCPSRPMKKVEVVATGRKQIG